MSGYKGLKYETYNYDDPKDRLRVYCSYHPADIMT